MEPEKIETSLSPAKGSGENKSSTAMEAEKFEGRPWVPLTTPTPKVLALLERNRSLPKPKGTIKTIKDLDTGAVIDCVDFWQQPGFNNPKVLEDYKKHHITFPPQNVPTIPFDEHYEKTKNLNGVLECDMTTQNWHKYGECPEGTIPILRRPKYGTTSKYGVHRLFDKQKE